MVLVKNFKLLTVILINKISINRYKYITNSHLATRVVYAALRFLYLAGQSHPFCYGPCRAFEKTVSERERENETDSCLWLVETTRVLFLQVESDSIQTIPHFIPLNQSSNQTKNPVYIGIHDQLPPYHLMKKTFILPSQPRRK